MHSEKSKSYSETLGREFHIDLFRSSIEEKGIILWLGGSGVDKDKYWSRGNSVNTIFDQTWGQMGQDPPIIFVYVTAPYDIRFSEFLNYPEDLEKWNRHVEKDILGKLPKLPIYIIGNSGGAALALNGLHKLPDIKGVGCVGGDQIPEKLDIPLKEDGEPKWYLKLYYNWDDPVYNQNLMAINKLETKRLIEINRYEDIHCTEDYILNRSVEGLIRAALRTFI